MNTAAPTMTTPSTMLTSRLPRKMIGCPPITPCSLPAAMSEPEKVTLPMITSSSVATVVVPSTPPARGSVWM
jgi:hypothetical protein